MKYFTFTIIFTLIILPINGQTVKKEDKFVSVLNQTIHLNGGNRSFFGGKSRMVKTILLPPNTIEWFYRIKTSPIKSSSSESTGLLSQIKSLAENSLSLTAISRQITNPSGANICDVYLFRDLNNANAFEEKVDLYGGTFYYYGNYSMKRVSEGTKYIKTKTPSKLYLGFKNPSSTTGVYINFDVVAKIEEIKIVERTQDESKAEMFGNLARSSYELAEYQKSLELCKKALEYNPNLGRVHNIMGLIYLIKGDFISAIDSYTTAITLFNKSEDPEQSFFDAEKDLIKLINKHGQLDGSSEIFQLLQGYQ